MRRSQIIIFLLLIFSGFACESQQQTFRSPPGYDFSRPDKFRMPKELHEISGLAFDKGRSDTIYTEEDNDGKVFRFPLSNIKPEIARFEGKGDFEDISICRGFVIMLRSDGVLFSFPLSETRGKDAIHVKHFDQLLPAGEYEGLSSTEATGQVYALCKHCADEKASKAAPGYIFTISPGGDLVAAGTFSINVRDIEKISGSGKIKFHPSALAQNPVTGDWYVLSSVNKMLVIADSSWNVKDVIPLNPALFPQPEGMAFDRAGNLYISNERNTRAFATILRFNQNPKR